MNSSCTGLCLAYSIFSTLFNIAGHVIQAPPDVPQYVLDYAPLVWLYSDDMYRPSDIGAQLVHTQPENNFTVVQNAPSPLTLDNLASLNDLGGTDVYLTSIDNATQFPSWLFGVTPDSTGKTNNATSCTIIVHDRGNGSVDAFYMYFYAYNQGPTVKFINEQFGDHVGDWEHNMIRFQDGMPSAIWYSQHSSGKAYTYDAVEKSVPPTYLNTSIPYYGTMRPVSYSANGSHANYVTSGVHGYAPASLGLPLDTIADYTNQGVLWDPTLAAYYYTVSFPGDSSSDAGSSSSAASSATSASSAAASTPSVVTVPGGGSPSPIPTFSAYTPASPSAVPPTNWLNYVGQWGDQQYPDNDPQQVMADGYFKYTSGPTGPEDKGLDRSTVCLGVTGQCIIHDSI